MPVLPDWLPEQFLVLAQRLVELAPLVLVPVLPAFPAQVLPVWLPEQFLVLAQHLVELALRVLVPALQDLPVREQFLVAQHLAELAQGASVRALVASLVPAALPFPEEFLVHQ